MRDAHRQLFANQQLALHCGAGRSHYRLHVGWLPRASDIRGFTALSADATVRDHAAERCLA